MPEPGRQLVPPNSNPVLALDTILRMINKKNFLINIKIILITFTVTSIFSVRGKQVSNFKQSCQVESGIIIHLCMHYWKILI